jgi:hypothetical protein
LTEMDFLTVSVKMAQTFEATTIRGKRGTFITRDRNRWLKEREREREREGERERERISAMTKERRS